MRLFYLGKMVDSQTGLHDVANQNPVGYVAPSTNIPVVMRRHHLWIHVSLAVSLNLGFSHPSSCENEEWREAAFAPVASRTGNIHRESTR